MYQKQFVKWNLTKNKREEDMLFVLYKLQERERVGKDTTFRVRGHIIEQKDVHKYFARKGGIPNTQAPPERATTPPHIRYRTPPPQASLKGSQALRALSARPQYNANTIEDSFSRESTATLSQISMFDPTMTESLPGGYRVSFCTANEARRFFAAIPRLVYQPSPLPIYHSSQELFSSVTLYFDECFGSRVFVPNDIGGTVSIRARPDTVKNLEAFYGHVISGAEQFKKGSYVEARRMLSSACQLVDSIIVDEHARSLDCFLELFLELKKEKHQVILDFIRNYISQMTITLVKAGRLSGTWARIWDLIGSIGNDQLEGALLGAWECQCLAFERILGTSHLSTIRLYIEYVRVKYENDARAAEIMLHPMLAAVSTKEDHLEQTFLLTAGLARSLRNQNKLTECIAVATSLLEKVRAAAPYPKSHIHEDMALHHILNAHYLLHSFPAAERYLREVIEVNQRAYGPKYFKSVRYSTQLETWLREWRRYEEADELKMQINIWIGKDDVDEALELGTLQLEAGS